MDSVVTIPKIPNSRTFITVIVILSTITWLFVGLRCWTRLKIVKVWGWDDTTIVFATLSYTAMTGLGLTIVIDASEGILPYHKLLTLVNISIAAEVLYMLTVMSFKTSLVILFRRILQQGKQRLLLNVTLAITIAFGGFHIFWIIFQCGVPRSAETIVAASMSGQCISRKASIRINYAHSTLNLVIDIVLVLLSIPTTWKTQLSRREKVVITFLFGLVSLSFAATAIRMIWIRYLTSFQLDFFRNAASLLMWSCVESAIGVTVTCLITLRKFFHRVLHSVTSLMDLSLSPIEVHPSLLGGRLGIVKESQGQVHDIGSMTAHSRISSRSRGPPTENGSNNVEMTELSVV